jgi:uncharacterized RDD family membrane protein YckC
MSNPDASSSPPPQAPPPPSSAAPQQTWQSQPQTPAAAPAGSGTATTMAPGPVAGTTIADFVTRVVAYVIDALILGVVGYVLWAILGGALLFSLGALALLIHAVLIIAVSAGYFVYFWTTRRQTPGMIVMKLMVVQDGTGAALDQSQAIRRWLYLGLPYALSTLLSVGFGFGFFGLGALAILFTLAPLVALIALGWQVYLAYTTYQDARKQGVHDKAVNSVVISVGPSPLAGMRT